jgi:alpha-glucosidase
MFNGWNPNDKKYHFQKNDKGNCILGTKLENGMDEFKITRGGWDKVECKQGGADIQNRFLKLLQIQ